jgi:hypothetical protein
MGSPPPRVSLIEVVRVSAYLPRNARALMRARQLGGRIKYLSQGATEAHNRGYSPYSVETWRTWEYWANNKAGCAHLLTRPDSMRTRQKADPQIGRFPLGAIADVAGACARKARRRFIQRISAALSAGARAVGAAPRAADG